MIVSELLVINLFTKMLRITALKISWKVQTEHKLLLYADDVILFITKLHTTIQTQ